MSVLAAPDPAVAALFGDGTHPTAQLAAAALRELCSEHPGASVLDVGTGTGVLARAAVTHGASHVVGIDVHERAIAHARAWVPRATFLVADAFAWLPRQRPGSFDVVVANLPDPPLLPLVPSLVRVARLSVVLTGTLLWQTDALARALASAGAHPGAPRALSGWSLVPASLGYPPVMPREKVPGMDIEEAKARLRLEELEEETQSCEACQKARTSSGDPTTYCDPHLRRLYGLQGL